MPKLFTNERTTAKIQKSNDQSLLKRKGWGAVNRSENIQVATEDTKDKIRSSIIIIQNIAPLKIKGTTSSLWAKLSMTKLLFENWRMENSSNGETIRFLNISEGSFER